MSLIHKQKCTLRFIEHKKKLNNLQHLLRQPSAEAVCFFTFFFVAFAFKIKTKSIELESSTFISINSRHITHHRLRLT